MSLSGNLNIQMRELTNGVAMVVFAGEIDMHTSPRAKEVMLHLLAQGYRDLLVNLHQTVFMDSSALGVLVGMQRRFRESGGEVRLVAPPMHLRRLFELTRLTYAFTIYHTEREALQNVFAGEETRPAA